MLLHFFSRWRNFSKFSNSPNNPLEKKLSSGLETSVDFRGDCIQPSLQNFRNFDETFTRKITKGNSPSNAPLTPFQRLRVRGNHRPLRLPSILPSTPPPFFSLFHASYPVVLFVRIARCSLFVSRLVSYTGRGSVCACTFFAKVAGARLSPLMETARQRERERSSFHRHAMTFSPLALARLDSRKSALDGFVAPKW